VTAAAAAAGLAGALGLGLSLRFNWWRPRRSGTPILMYHQIGPHRKRSALNRWRVTSRDFERQLDLLAARGYRGVALRDLLDAPKAPVRRAVLTFDDGYAALVSEAVPRLLERGFSATIFVVAGRLGGTNDWDTERPGEALLSAADIRALHAAGIEIGSHGATHRALPGLSDEDLDRETAGSRSALEAILGAPVTTFCYPFGACDDRTVAAVKRAGYRAATVIRGGIADDLSDPFRLRRVVVRGTDTMLDFKLALTRGRSKL
jgi:peptidoglycan/xylan/chitin deacetylase (PgdA/CDA1 family)